MSSDVHHQDQSEDEELSEPMENHNRVVVVTGAGRGIGAGITARFADEGGFVVGVDLTEPTDPDGRVRYETADVSSAEEVGALFSRIKETYGRLDVLVNNVGIWFRRPFKEITVEEWDRVLAINLRSVFLCTRHAIDLMEGRGGGAIVNVGSQAGLTVTRGQGVHYHASKAAISHMTKALAFELGPAGIRINCVAPGVTPDQSVPPYTSQALLDQIPLGRPGRPVDIANACAFLASSQAEYITGQTLLVNGGAVAFL
jgi:meso-butanediol dehydrogenase / (S,S)-butanediol dehydrogenase / diacetyl reductase